MLLFDCGVLQDAACFVFCGVCVFVCCLYKCVCVLFVMCCMLLCDVCFVRFWCMRAFVREMIKYRCVCCLGLFVRVGVCVFVLGGVCVCCLRVLYTYGRVLFVIY